MNGGALVLAAYGVAASGLPWPEPEGSKDVELYQVLPLRDGKIVDMRDFERRPAALQAAGAQP